MTKIEAPDTSAMTIEEAADSFRQYAFALSDEHVDGDHADFVDMDCPDCVAEARTLGMVPA